VLLKRIFLLGSMPKAMLYLDEIQAMKPTELNKDLTKIEAN